MHLPSLTAHTAPARRGRPPGTLSPLTRWLRGVISELRRGGLGQAEAWRRLCMLENGDGDGLSFAVSEETADEVWRDVGADLSGERVTWASFRSTWRRANF